MKLYFDHITGKLTNYDLVYSLALAHFDKLKKSMKLDNETKILNETTELEKEYIEEVDSLTNE